MSKKLWLCRNPKTQNNSKTWDFYERIAIIEAFLLSSLGILLHFQLKTMFVISNHPSQLLGVFQCVLLIHVYL